VFACIYKYVRLNILLIVFLTSKSTCHYIFDQLLCLLENDYWGGYYIDPYYSSFFTIYLIILYNLSHHCFQFISSFYTIYLIILYNLFHHFIQFISSFYTICLIILYNLSHHFIQFISSFYTIYLIIFCNLSLAGWKLRLCLQAEPLGRFWGICTS
jgi:hypothetical protein